MNNIVKIGLLGVGMMGQNHLRNLSMLKQVEVTFIYDFDKEKKAIAIEQAKKDVIQREDMRRQKLLRNSFIIGFLIVCLSVIIIYYY